MCGFTAWAFLTGAAQNLTIQISLASNTYLNWYFLKSLGHSEPYRWQWNETQSDIRFHIGDRGAAGKTCFFLDLDLAARNFELKCETWSNMTYFSKHIRWQNSMLNIFSEDSPIRSFDQIAQMHDRKSIWGIPTGTWADFLSNVIDSSPVHVAKYPSQISGAGTSGNHIYLTR